VLDFSAVDEFWHVEVRLSADQEPTDAEWQRLLATPGYRLAARAYGDVLQEDLRLAFKPSRRAAFDSVTRLGNGRAARLLHLTRAASLRARLGVFRDSLVRSAVVARAVARAARFLPPGATDAGTPPLVAFAIFADDGYSFGDSILVDLLHAEQTDVVPFLAHEFHHTYVERLAPEPPASAGSPADRDLRTAIENLRKEGIADLIDKPYPVSFASPALGAYARTYNDEYAKTPATLRTLDSLLCLAADDTTSIADVGRRAKALLWSSGHANGAYIAREILETFGVDSLLPATKNPGAFLRTFAAAERAHGRAPPLTPKATRILAVLERRYWSTSPAP
jgi:hypothetical protein